MYGSSGLARWPGVGQERQRREESGGFAVSGVQSPRTLRPPRVRPQAPLSWLALLPIKLPNARDAIERLKAWGQQGGA